MKQMLKIAITETPEMSIARQVLAAILLLCILSPLMRGAFAEGTPTDIQVTPDYAISFGLPAGWRNTESAMVKVKVTDRQHTGWRKIEARFDGGDWLDMSERFLQASDHQISLEVTGNVRVSIRVTDPQGGKHMEEAMIQCFDRQAPVVTASVDDVLRVQAEDDLSGMAGVQVCGLLFTSMDDGALNIQLSDALNRYEKLAIRAFDFAGNFSDVMTLPNPYYIAPTSASTVAPTEAPTATPKPTRKPSGGGQGGNGSSSNATSAPVSSAPAEAVPTAILTAAPAATPAPVTEYVALGPGMPYLSEGNGHTLDVLYSAHTNKQFITVQSKNGETFYLVIDYDKPIDEAAELYETYFLNLVDERDLMAFLSEDEVPTPTPEVIYVTPEPTKVPVVTAAPDTTSNSDNTPMMLLTVALLAVVVVGGGVFIFMQMKAKGQKKPDFSEYSFEDEEETSQDESE